MIVFSFVMANWHQKSISEIYELLKTSRLGLSAQEAEQRLSKYGHNSLTEKKRVGPVRRFLLHFHDLLIYVLLIAAILTAIMHEWIDSGVIFGVVIINAVIGFIQESKAEQALTSLKKMLSLRAEVIRDGNRTEISAEYLVPGDVVLLSAGDRVPADLRLDSARNLQINESTLTGESLPVIKSCEPITGESDIGDRINMAFNGTFVTSGQATGIVTVTGDNTELGKIAGMLQEVEEVKTPLTRKLTSFSKSLTIFIMAGCAAVYAFGTMVRGLPAMDMFMAAVAIAISAIPEGLPAIMTITLAIGVTRMVERNAIIRKLPAVETLGSTRIICTDKTGTLTRNEMTVTSIITPEGNFEVTGTGYTPIGELVLNGISVDISTYPTLMELLRAGILCNDSVLSNTGEGWKIEGDPTEGALIVAAVKVHMKHDHEKQLMPRFDSIPFEPEQQYMSTLHHDRDGKTIIYIKGAPEQIIPFCDFPYNNAGVRAESELWEERAQGVAANGLRILGMAGKVIPGEQESLTLEDIKKGGFTFFGIAGMRDPVRPEALSAVTACKEAGIGIKMITGDHALTARVIAGELGLGHGVLTGKELDQLADEEFDRAVSENDVFARVNPGHKLRLVRSLQKAGEIVAMTGDGVNDAPALKQADIGIAMGITGTEVSKDAADMVVTDDNFASIERAVEEGRTVFNNLKKTIMFILPTNGGECLVIIWAIFTGTLLPVLPLHILWINMITTVALAITLAFEPVESGTMKISPRIPDAPIFERYLVWRIILVSIIMAAGTFGLFYYEMDMGQNLQYARTTAVNTIVFFEIFYVFNTRFLSGSVLNIEGLTGNKIIVIGAITVILFQVLFTYFPVFNRLFQTEPLALFTWLRITAVAASIFFLVELEKLVVNR